MAVLSYAQKRMKSKSLREIAFYDMADDFTETFRRLNETIRASEDTLVNMKTPPPDHSTEGAFVKFCRREQNWIIESSHSQILRYGLFLSTYCYAEGVLDRVCRVFYTDKFESEGSLPLKSVLTNLKRDKGIRRAKKFLIENLQIEIDSRFMRGFPLLNKIRNILVHSHGNPDTVKEEELADARKHLEMEPFLRENDPVECHLKKLLLNFEVCSDYGVSRRLVLHSEFTEAVAHLFHFALQRVLHDAEEQMKSRIAE